jgi:hypothetical protein
MFLTGDPFTSRLVLFANTAEGTAKIRGIFALFALRRHTRVSATPYEEQ